MNEITKPIQQARNHLMRKVPEVTIYFWIIKLLTTGMGETTSDFLVRKIDPVIAVVLGAIALAVALILQFRAKKYITWIYWLAVAMVAIFGTMVADVLHIGLGIPYLVSSIFFAIALAIIFFTWYKFEGTLSIHSITTHRREFFYWATVMATFALGTAAGDMTATTLQLGYFDSGILFALLFALPAIAYWKFGMNEIFTFWFAYIITRPLGASFADWIGRPTNLSGVGFGTGQISLVLAILISILVIYLSITRKDSRRVK
ncbi:MAG: COG4705 family protein [Candidatus Levyibacteriota bacterium]